MGVSHISSVDPEALREPKLPFKTHQSQIFDAHIFLTIVSGTNLCVGNTRRINSRVDKKEK